MSDGPHKSLEMSRHWNASQNAFISERTVLRR